MSQALWGWLRRLPPSHGRPGHVRHESPHGAGLRERSRGGGNGDSDKEDRLYTVLNVQFPEHPNGGMAVFLLDLEGVACSGGSACSSGATLGSHVLRALEFHDPNKASVRFSFSRYTSEADIDFALDAAQKVFAPAEEVV